MRRTSIIGAVAAVAATLATAAPALATSAPPDGTITLTLGWAAGPDRPRGAVAARFAEEVAKATDGAVNIDVQYDLGQEYLDAYRNGDVDMVLTPAVSAPLLGVATLDVLSFPYLVTEDDQADRVAERDIADELLAGFADIDSTGLLLAPTYPVHLSIAGGAPLRSLDQLQAGIRVWPTAGEPLQAIYSAMGLTEIDDLSGDVWSQAVDDGTALAAEWPLQLAGGIPGPQMMAANWTQYYDFAVIAGHNDALAMLSDEQQAQLAAAADATVQASIDERVREEDAFRDACTLGAELTAMPSTLIANFGLAVDDTIIAALDDDEDHLYDKVHRAAGLPALEWPNECHLGETTGYVPAAPDSTEFPEGTYRGEGRTFQSYLVTGLGDNDATNNANDYTEWTFRDGVATYTFYKNGGQAEAPCSISYVIDDEGYLTAGDSFMESCGWETTYTWHATADGISLEAMPSDEPTAWSLSTGMANIAFANLVGVH